MSYIGFSTGALAFGDFTKAIKLMSSFNMDAIELSALRRHELEPLVNAINHIDLTRYKYISVHAPSKISPDDEPNVIKLLYTFAEKNWPIVIHPDAITIFERWRVFGNLLLIENMDDRKSIGKTCNELEAIFDKLPDARFCFDIAHARQFDHAMHEARIMLQTLSSLITQVHISDIEGHSFKHTRISSAAISDYKMVADYIPLNVAIILESVIESSEIDMELKSAECALFYTSNKAVYQGVCH